MRLYIQYVKSQHSEADKGISRTLAGINYWSRELTLAAACFRASAGVC